MNKDKGKKYKGKKDKGKKDKGKKDKKKKDELQGIMDGKVKRTTGAF